MGTIYRFTAAMTILAAAFLAACGQLYDAMECEKALDCEIGSICHNGICKETKRVSDTAGPDSTFEATELPADTLSESSDNNVLQDNTDSAIMPAAEVDSDTFSGFPDTEKTDTALNEEDDPNGDSGTGTDSGGRININMDSESANVPPSDTETGTDTILAADTESATETEKVIDTVTDTGSDVSFPTETEFETETDTATIQDTDTEHGIDSASDSESEVAPIYTETLIAVADTCVRADKLVRVDDNYGCDRTVAITRGRDYVVGAPGMTQAYFKFDIPEYDTPVTRALLELTVSRLARFDNPERITLGVFKIVNSGDERTPWVEGNGSETAGAPEYCEHADFALGVSWVDDDDNSYGRPDIDPLEYATYSIPAEDYLYPGDKVVWDVTALVNEWIAGEPGDNLGIAIMITDWGSIFHSIEFGTREGEIYTYSDGISELPRIKGPRLNLEWRHQTQ
ncbi:MAG: hypothetical protein JXR76_21565 [Deltaproteobacteria bacterium]|nr:hypothetical protein [Deltaproteobacteria bacterium]